MAAGFCLTAAWLLLGCCLAAARLMPGCCLAAAAADDDDAADAADALMLLAAHTADAADYALPGFCLTAAWLLPLGCCCCAAAAWMLPGFAFCPKINPQNPAPEKLPQIDPNIVPKIGPTIRIKHGSMFGSLFCKGLELSKCLYKALKGP